MTSITAPAAEPTTLRRVASAAGRAAWWELRECGSFARDIWQERYWPGWALVGFLTSPGVVASLVAIHSGHTVTWRLLGLATLVWFIGCLLLWKAQIWQWPIWSGVGVLIVPGMLAVLSAAAFGVGSWVGLGVGFLVAYPVVAGVTGVPRARHFIRRDLRLAVWGETTGSNVDDPPSQRRRFLRVPRTARVRWVRWTRKLKSAVPVLPQAHMATTEDERLRIAETIVNALPYQEYAVDWPPEQKLPRVHPITALPRMLEYESRKPPKGVVLLGRTEGHNRHAAIVDELPYAPWRRYNNPHLLIAGETGTGKTSLLRSITRELRDAADASDRGLRIAFLDGKGAGNGDFLKGREGTYQVNDTPAVGNKPHQWRAIAKDLHEEMEDRYEQLLAWNDPFNTKQTKKPWWPDDVVVIVDEWVDIQKKAGDPVIEPLSEIARLGREAGFTIVASVLRPDIAESIDGLTRAQFGARLLLGAVFDRYAADMMFGTRWKQAMAASDPEDDAIPGRGIARLGGRIYRIQIPHTANPAEDREAADLWLPERVEATVHDLEEARDRRQDPAKPDTAAVVKAIQRRTATAGPIDLTGTDEKGTD